jgi:hypothetical protein
MYAPHIQHVIENISFYTIHKSSVSTAFAEQIMLILHIFCYNGSLVTWTAVSLTTAKFIPRIFSMSVFTLSYTANMYILMILYGFCLLPAQFCYVIVYIRKVKSGPMCTLENFQWCADPCFACAAISRGRCLPLIPRRGEHKSWLSSNLVPCLQLLGTDHVENAVSLLHAYSLPRERVYRAVH